LKEGIVAFASMRVNSLVLTLAGVIAVVVTM
jgi:hypothetical protein